MSTIDDEIRRYGQRRDWKNLRKVVQNVDDDELIQIMKDKILTANFSFTLNYLMQALDTPNLHRKRFKFVKALLQEMEDVELQSWKCNAIASRVIQDLHKFNAGHLVELCAFCLECIQNGAITGMSWRKDFVPELLRILSERSIVEHNDVEMTGVEYKTQVLQSLGMMNWSPSILTSLAAMFGEMDLSKEEHLSVVSKLGQSIERLTPHEVPAFVYQLLKLCKKQNSMSVFGRLQNYFESRVNRGSGNSDSSSTDSIDLIENANEQQVKQAESTVLFHIHNSASSGNEVKDYLNSLKNATKAPEFIIQPFQLSVLLTLSTIECYEEKATEVVRLSISRTLYEEEKRDESCWVREMTRTAGKLEEVITQVIDASSEERDTVIQGMMNLGFVLLGVGKGLGRDNVVERLWHLGTFILLKLMKHKQKVAPIVLEMISNRIVTGQNVKQYIECLCLMSNNMALLMLGNINGVLKLLRYLVQIPGRVAQNLLLAIVPLTKFSPTIRDQFILLLRKALYSPSIETRQMATAGFLKLLKILKISNMAALSQSSSSSFSSGRTLYTQIATNVTSQMTANNPLSNEALCLEVLGILKRCFMQQAEVRSQLYNEFYSAVCNNSELGVPVLDMIWLQFCDFYVCDESVALPLDFSKISATKNVEVSLKEPLGKLVYTIALILNKMQELDERNVTVRKFGDIFDSLTKRMISCDLIQFELDDGTDLTDIVPESQHKVLVLKEAMQVYEALIGYHIISWKESSENCAQSINSLFQGYMRLVHFSKNLTNPKKAAGRKKKGDVDTTSQNTTAGNATRKELPNAVKLFKLPTTLLDLRTVAKLLEVLHQPRVPWTTIAQANVIKTKQEFHRHALQATVDIVQSLKNTTCLDRQESHEHFNLCTSISTILYERCIQRLNEFTDFDTTSAVLATECFYCILMYVCQKHEHHFTRFLEQVCDKKGEDAAKVLRAAVSTFKELLSFDEEVDDAESRKLAQTIVNILGVLVGQMSVESRALSMEVMEWLKSVMDTKTTKNKQLATSLLTLFCNLHLKFKNGLQFFETMASRVESVVGSIDDEEHVCAELQFINEAVALSTFQLLCGCVKTTLEDVDWIINRIKAEYSVINIPGDEQNEKRREDLRKKERGVCCQMSFIGSILNTLSNVGIPPGANLECLLKNVRHFYISLNSLTKYFNQCSSKANLVFQAARFEQLVRLVGKQLSQTVYRLILFIEESQKQADEESGKKVNSTALKSKVLRETRLIPKVIYDIEQMSKSVTLLSNKTKVNLSKYLGQGYARDFRILRLKDVLDKSGEDMNTTTGETTIDESHVTAEDESSGNEDASPQPAKRLRK